MSSSTEPAITPTRPLLAAIAVLSAGALASEILLTRLFSIIQWHHFAYMIISLALLGFGASGTLLTIAGEWLVRRFPLSFGASATLFGVSTYGCFVAAQGVPFNALEILWDPWQLGALAAMYLLLMVPFLCAATCIALAFLRYRAQIDRLYAFDLAGAGAGSLGVVLLLLAAPPLYALKVVAACGPAAAALAWVGLRARPRWGVVVPVALLLLLLHPAGSGSRALDMSPYKPLSQTLRASGAEVVATRSSPLGLIQVVRSPHVPLRYAPGLSLTATSGPPEQLAVFTDGDGLSAITRFDGRLAPLAFLGAMTSAAPYHLLHAPGVLVLGAGGGMDVLQALYHGARRVDAVELNPQMVALVRDTFRDFAGDVYDRKDVQVHVAEARGFVSASRRHYDLIQVALLDSFSASSAGLYALAESHLYTVEALRAYLSRLKTGGVLALTRWVKLPPRDGIKLFATAVAALDELGVRDPGRHLAWLRGWSTSTLLIKNGPLSAADVAALREFAANRSFDVAYYPGMPAREANRFNRLDRPYFYAAAKALLGPQRARFLRDYRFQVAPATDDRPYFFNYFKWSALPAIVALRTRGGVALFELGYLVLVATLVQAVLASLVLILLPLGVRQRLGSAGASPRGLRLRVLLYFLALGFAFLFLEIAFIQRFTLFLAHPLYAVAVVLAGFLLFAGLGSRFSARGRGAWGRGVLGPVAAIVVLGAAYVVLTPVLFEGLIGLAAPIKIAITLALIAPLAFCMGMPFPRGLARLPEGAGDLVAWAWGINGCASVVGAVLGTLLAIHLGFAVVLWLALALYAGAALLLGPSGFAPGPRT
jgi:hypothetical protein